VLELRNLVKHYQVGKGDPIRALDGVSMTVAAGEFVALYGPSGSGKTTLTEIIAAKERADSGTVLVNGQDIAGLSGGDLDEYRLKQIGVVASTEMMLPGIKAIKTASIRLLLSKAREASATIEPLMIQLGLGDRLDHRTEELSMGERQRVMIARALSTEPRLVLADEPTGSLDTDRTVEVLQMLRESCAERGVTVLLTTHDLMVASFADHIHELRDGRLQEYQPRYSLVPTADTDRQHA
jgi:putative ABC transport system ATP-binding protein